MGTFVPSPLSYFLMIRRSHIFPSEYQTLMCSYFKMSDKSWIWMVFKNEFTAHITKKPTTRGKTLPKNIYKTIFNGIKWWYLILKWIRNSFHYFSESDARIGASCSENFHLVCRSRTLTLNFTDQHYPWLKLRQRLTYLLMCTSRRFSNGNRVNRILN